MHKRPLQSQNGKCRRSNEVARIIIIHMQMAPNSTPCRRVHRAGLQAAVAAVSRNHAHDPKLLSSLSQHGAVKNQCRLSKDIAFFRGKIHTYAHTPQHTHTHTPSVFACVAARPSISDGRAAAISEDNDGATPPSGGV